MLEQASRWTALSASVCGESHRRAGRANDDALEYLVKSDGTLIAAIADGAGSATHSRFGSRTAVVTACDLADRLLDDAPIGDSSAAVRFFDRLLPAIRNRLESLSFELGLDLSELATTLCVCIAGSHGTALVQIGDGGIVLQHPTGKCLMPIWPHDSEYLNETRFLTSADFAEAARVRFFRYLPTAIALLTDGLEPIAVEYAQRTVFGPFFQRMFRFAVEAGASPESLETFLGSARVAERTDDDRTLFLAVRSGL